MSYNTHKRVDGEWLGRSSLADGTFPYRDISAHFLYSLFEVGSTTKDALSLSTIYLYSLGIRLILSHGVDY
ncbi:hypothetical protein PMIT1320_01029 [Prochlorococcus marinus str. MIT 1320]|nr:hypothetical protein PMIT1320_01029 [Prochlorococcus marinus str. MIT 1320]